MSAGADRSRLRADLEALGLFKDAIVLVQASLRRTRPDAGGPATVAGAMLDVLGPGGTIVVPTQTAWNSTTSRAHRAATKGLTPAEIEAYLASLPVFDPLVTPSAGMGAFAEYIRTMPGAVRSSHPQTSFAAVGAQAAELMAVHELGSHLGPESPLGALHAHDALVLLLGVSYQEGCTMFHLAEYHYAVLPKRLYRARAVSAAPGSGGWLDFTDIDYDDSDFERLGKDFEYEAGVVPRPVGSADARLFRAADAVGYAAKWMARERR